MAEPWFEADIKIYTPRLRTSYALAEDAPGASAAPVEQEALSLWQPAAMRTQPPMDDQPYIEP